MSAIPPNWLASVIQAQGAQQRAAQTQSTQAADQARRVSNDSVTSKSQATIENEDRDSQVFADAEGQGSQGRSYDECRPPENPEPDDEESPPGAALDVSA